MLLVECPQCQVRAFPRCGCPPAAQGHLAGCDFTNLDALITCRPDGGCCQEDHAHGEASACAGDHGDCPSPDDCPVWKGMERDGECPGGHCGKDVPGCPVCRTLIITALPGSVALVSGGGA